MSDDVTRDQLFHVSRWLLEEVERLRLMRLNILEELERGNLTSVLPEAEHAAIIVALTPTLTTAMRRLSKQIAEQRKPATKPRARQRAGASA